MSEQVKLCLLPPTGWLYSPVRMRSTSKKKSHNFQRLLLSSILHVDLIEFFEDRDKKFQLRSMLFQSC